jgi:hypothetical protein
MGKLANSAAKRRLPSGARKRAASSGQGPLRINNAASGAGPWGPRKRAASWGQGPHESTNEVLACVGLG